MSSFNNISWNSLLLYFRRQLRRCFRKSSFNDTNWNSLLPNYLTASDKGRLQTALQQFQDATKKIAYTDFYTKTTELDFLQADLVYDIRLAHWNKEAKMYEKRYVASIIVSNSCDISTTNSRATNTKQCILAPLVEMEIYLEERRRVGISEGKINSLRTEIMQQSISNLFYLPENTKNNTAYIAQLDKLFWFPVDELHKIAENIAEERIAQLSIYGFYLFMIKLSFHLCRLPEEKDRNY